MLLLLTRNVGGTTLTTAMGGRAIAATINNATATARAIKAMSLHVVLFLVLLLLDDTAAETSIGRANGTSAAKPISPTPTYAPTTWLPTTWTPTVSTVVDDILSPSLQQKDKGEKLDEIKDDNKDKSNGKGKNKVSPSEDRSSSVPSENQDKNKDKGKSNDEINAANSNSTLVDSGGVAKQSSSWLTEIVIFLAILFVSFTIHLVRMFKSKTRQTSAGGPSYESVGTTGDNSKGETEMTELGGGDVDAEYGDTFDDEHDTEEFVNVETK